MSFNLENDNLYRKEIPIFKVISTHIQLDKDTAPEDYAKRKKYNR